MQAVAPPAETEARSLLASGAARKCRRDIGTRLV
jgi:hypothetical protein